MRRGSSCSWGTWRWVGPTVTHSRVLTQGQGGLAGCLLQSDVSLKLQGFFCFCLLNTVKGWSAWSANSCFPSQAWRSAAKGSWWLQHEEGCQKLYQFSSVPQVTEFSFPLILSQWRWKEKSLSRKPCIKQVPLPKKMPPPRLYSRVNVLCRHHTLSSRFQCMSLAEEHQTGQLMHLELPFLLSWKQWSQPRALQLAEPSADVHQARRSIRGDILHCLTERRAEALIYGWGETI